MRQNAEMFRRLDAESYIARRLGEHGARIFDGDTTELSRKERIRAAILEANLNAKNIGTRPDGRRETYAECFERFYGEPLVTHRTEA